MDKLVFIKQLLLLCQYTLTFTD